MARSESKITAGPALDNVVHDLELDLVLGRIRPRERLIEDELMMRFGAKRHVVRSALTELERRGLIERRQNKGARVREFSREEVEALYEFRGDLHQLAVSRMALPLSDKVVAELVKVSNAHEAAWVKGELALVIEQNNRFHNILFDQCGNPFLAETIKRMAAATNAIRSYRIGDPDLLRLAVQEHRQMINAAQDGDRHQLALLCRQHILPSRDLYLRDQIRLV